MVVSIATFSDTIDMSIRSSDTVDGVRDRLPQDNNCPLTTMVITWHGLQLPGNLHVSSSGMPSRATLNYAIRPTRNHFESRALDGPAAREIDVKHPQIILHIQLSSAHRLSISVASLDSVHSCSQGLATVVLYVDLRATLLLETGLALVLPRSQD